MDALLTDSGKLLLTQGVLGLAVLVLGMAVFYLYREQRECLECRIQEALKLAASREEMAKALNANTLALEGNNRAMEARTRATEAVERSLAELTRQSQNNDERMLERLNEIRLQLADGLRRAEEISRQAASAATATRGSAQ